MKQWILRCKNSTQEKFVIYDFKNNSVRLTSSIKATTVFTEDVYIQYGDTILSLCGEKGYKNLEWKLVDVSIVYPVNRPSSFNDSMSEKDRELLNDSMIKLGTKLKKDIDKIDLYKAMSSNNDIPIVIPQSVLDEAIILGTKKEVLRIRSCTDEGYKKFKDGIHSTIKDFKKLHHSDKEEIIDALQDKVDKINGSGYPLTPITTPYLTVSKNITTNPALDKDRHLKLSNSKIRNSIHSLINSIPVPKFRPVDDILENLKITKKNKNMERIEEPTISQVELDMLERLNNKKEEENKK